MVKRDVDRGRGPSRGGTSTAKYNWSVPLIGTVVVCTGCRPNRCIITKRYHLERWLEREHIRGVPQIGEIETEDKTLARRSGCRRSVQRYHRPFWTRRSLQFHAGDIHDVVASQRSPVKSTWKGVRAGISDERTTSTVPMPAAKAPRVFCGS